MEQVATTCTEHDECIVVTCTDGGEVVWISHAPADRTLDDIANVDYPAIETGA